ncbi:hypothetical protein PSI23_20450 [Xenorhabdus sp. XENO-10]|uniref:Uncharacterized protein n=1 Tax=Xenorhabdus yunnanensis TaxID=3025878 RepID=A0ABT5LP27_9GAMM|nr:hypothetical protein [Xenorhabdus yunnanensis]MDC9591584.1 hypothetical protein [Xenorhabdus yunnanensis]
MNDNKLLDTYDYEEAITDMLSVLPWQTDSYDTLVEKVMGIIDSYKNCRGDVSLICVYWMTEGWMNLGAMKSGEYIPDENDKIKVTEPIRHMFQLVAGRLVNESAKNIASHMAHAHHSFEYIAKDCENLRNSNQEILCSVAEKWSESPHSPLQLPEKN